MTWGLSSYKRIERDQKYKDLEESDDFEECINKFREELKTYPLWRLKKMLTEGYRGNFFKVLLNEYYDRRGWTDRKCLFELKFKETKNE